MRRWLHRQIWQRLPRRLRRRVLFGLAGLLAPRPGPRPARADGPIYIVGALSTASGLGESARLALEALRQAGLDARGIDLSAALMQGGKPLHYDFPDTGDALGPGTLILHVSGFLMALAMLRLGRHRLRGKTVIGYWAWELPDLPADWRAGLRFAHEIWVPSRFTEAAVAHRSDLPVRVLPHPVPAADDAESRRPEGPVTVLTMLDLASSLARKNPLAAIAAFRQAFGDDPAWRLVVKLSDGAAYPEGYRRMLAAVAGAANIEIRDRLLDRVETGRLIDACDILLSLHRAEGFGLTLAEAMRRGKVVVATGWSGNIDFMTAENSCPVAYRLVPARDPQGTYDYPHLAWAEPDIADAARQLAALGDPALRRRLGKMARADAEARFAPRRYAETVSAYLGI